MFPRCFERMKSTKIGIQYPDVPLQTESTNQQVVHTPALLIWTYLMSAASSSFSRSTWGLSTKFHESTSLIPSDSSTFVLGAPNRHHPVAQLSPSTKESSAHLPDNQLVLVVTWYRLWTNSWPWFSHCTPCASNKCAQACWSLWGQIQNELKPNFVTQHFLSCAFPVKAGLETGVLASSRWTQSHSCEGQNSYRKADKWNVRDGWMETQLNS